MLSWAKGALASVAGTQEPEYGPDAIQSVAKQAQTTPYTLLSKQQQKWITPYTSSVETQTFYFNADDGKFGFLQVIYSNVAITATAQFNVQLFHLDDKSKPALWTSDYMEGYKFDDEKYNIVGDKASVVISDDGDSYTIKSKANLKSIVNAKFTKVAPGFVAGADGTTTYGTDPKNPWGSMRHSFWPRCKVEGTILTQQGEINISGRGVYIHALQGMKPHHAAARWNFGNFQSPSYSALIMEFTTPSSYAGTVVTVGGIVDKSDTILTAGAEASVTHTDIKGDSEVNWPEPAAVRYVWHGKSPDGKVVEATVEGPLGERLARVDVMGELPGFIKQIASSASGARPYIYQYGTKATIKVKVGDEVTEEEGTLFAEATFIS